MIPCRVSADLRRYQQEQAAAVPEEFDECEEHLRQIVPERLVKPLLGLLDCRRQINSAERIEGLNKERALEWLRKDAEAVYQACIDLWRDL